VTDQPFRLDDAVPTGKPFPFTFRGVAYALPPLGAWPLGVLEMATCGRFRDALAVLLGEDAADRLDGDGMTVGHMAALFEELGRMQKRAS
jgi:hypothetical protein